MKIENPTIIASAELVWLRKDGTEVLLQARIGTPYHDGAAWRCPAALEGLDGRYPDIAGEDSMQALSLALRLIRKRLADLLDAGELLVYPGEERCRWNRASLDAIFG